MRKQTFSSLANSNYRKYFRGQAVSLVGTWMQMVAQSWLVLSLTNSGAALGLSVALQTLPVLILGPYGGVVADRVDKRRLMIMLQSMMGMLALVLGLLTVTGVVNLGEVYVLAFLLGLNNCFENPARQSFILEMVGPEHLRNAVSLNSVLVNVARAVGPAIAGLIIAAGGTGVCFLLNAASFGAVVWSLSILDTSRLSPSPPSPRARGQLREGLAYVRRTPEIAMPLVMMALVGCLAYEFQVVLPILAKETFHGNSTTFGFMTAAMGIGAVIGGLFVAARGNTGVPALVRSVLIFGVVFLAAGLAPYLWLELLLLAAVGAAGIGFLSKGNSTLQLAAAPGMRGRVMALWAVAFMGSTPIGGPIAGWVSDAVGGRGGLILGAAACFAAGILGFLSMRRHQAAPGVAGGAPAQS
ncbi:MAG: MFS transporter [Mycobacteriales bacterium]